MKGRVPLPDGSSERQVDCSPSADVAALGTREQARWFSLLWVLAVALNYTDSQPLWALLMVAIGLPVLVYPTSAPAFGFFVAGAGVTAALDMPLPANHTVVSLFTALAFGLSALYVWLTRDRQASSQGDFLIRWFEAARTPVVLSLLIVYLFTVFDKLNTAFLDRATSCTGTLLGILLTLNGLAHPVLRPGSVPGFTMNDLGSIVSPDIAQLAAIGTVLVESSILVLLAVPRLRRWGLLLGVGFHLVLAPAAFWDFSTMVFTLYVLFVPARVFAELAPRWARIRMIALAAFGTHVLIASMVSLAGSTTSPIGLRWHTVLVLTWYVAVIPMMAQLLRACFSDRGPGSGYRFRPVVLLLVPALVFITGLSPYLGVKTTSNFSMFSNLHTEPGYANHLLPGVAVLQFAPYLRDTVMITSVNVRTKNSEPVALRWVQEKPPTTVPWLELRRAVAEWRDRGAVSIHLEFRHGGQTQVVDNALTDPELSAPLPWWQRRLLGFRAITSADGPDLCRL